jgi:hypothetical protein
MRKKRPVALDVRVAYFKKTIKPGLVNRESGGPQLILKFWKGKPVKADDLTSERVQICWGHNSLAVVP